MENINIIIAQTDIYGDDILLLKGG